MPRLYPDLTYQSRQNYYPGNMSCDHLRNAVQKFLNFPDPEAEVERDRITEIAVKKLINKYLAGKVPTNECLERLE